MRRCVRSAASHFNRRGISARTRNGRLRRPQARADAERLCACPEARSRSGTLRKVATVRSNGAIEEDIARQPGSRGTPCGPQATPVPGSNSARDLACADHRRELHRRLLDSGNPDERNMGCCHRIDRARDRLSYRSPTRRSGSLRSRLLSDRRRHRVQRGAGDHLAAPSTCDFLRLSRRLTRLASVPHTQGGKG